MRQGALCQSTSDTEVVLHLTARSRKPRFIERFTDALKEIEGAYAFVGLTNHELVGARDPLGIRPLVLGELDGCYILTSETVALDIIALRICWISSIWSQSPNRLAAPCRGGLEASPAGPG